MTRRCITISLLANLTTLFTSAQPVTTLAVDSLVNKALVTFNVPGIAVAIVSDDKIVLSKGYGLRSLESGKKVDENTLFGIASNSKAFTAAALAILVDEGKLKWDDKLAKYIPEFKMYEPYVTREFTIRDMLTHRSGLGLGAGDLLHNPDSTDFTIKDVIYALRWLKPESSFRSRYAYDNIFYLVAAELIYRVSGESWGDFVHKHIMLPLQMYRSNASYGRVKKDTNVIEGYEEIDGKLTRIQRDDAERDAGAGGIYASADDMGKWMLAQLNNGRYGEHFERQLFSAEAQEEMWKPQIIVPVGKNDGYNSHFGAYGFGWFLNDAKGYKIVSHTGQDNGMISQVLLIPELHAGITVLSNRDGGGAVRAIVDQITDYFLHVEGFDRIARWKAKVDAQSQATEKAKSRMKEFVDTSFFSNPKSTYASKTGTYRDNWFGIVTICQKDNRLYFNSKRSLQLHGPMFPLSRDSFLVRWDNRNLKADAIVVFENKGKMFTMKRATPETSAAYDFQDLLFQKQSDDICK